MPRWFHVAVPWTPSSVSGLLAWYDASDGATLYDATSGGSQVTTNGNAVKRWEDKHGSYDATEATNAPVLDTGSSGSLDFDGSNDQLAVATSFGSRSALTIVAFVRREGAVTYQSPVLSRGTDVSGISTDFLGTELRLIWNNDLYTDSTSLTIPLNEWSMLAVRYSAAEGKASLGTGSTISHSTKSVTLSSSTIDDLKIGVNEYNSRHWNGKIGTVLIYDEAISDSDLSDIFTNLGDRFGLG